jgi:tetratricopeptide (TPR) repeat protein
VPALVFSSLDLARLHGRRVAARTVLTRVGLSLVAILILVMVLFRKPVLSEAHFWLGTWALRKQESSGEISDPVRHHWQRAFDLNPRNLKARFWLAMAGDSDVLDALDRRNYEEAARLAEDNVRFMPEYFGFHQTLSTARRRAGDFQGAAEAMKQAIVVHRNADMENFARGMMWPFWTAESDLHRILARIYYDMEDYTKALEQMSLTARRMVAEARIHWDPIFSPSDEVFVGKTLWKLGEREAAESCFRSALRRARRYEREKLTEDLREFGWEPPPAHEEVKPFDGAPAPAPLKDKGGQRPNARPEAYEPATR